LSDLRNPKPEIRAAAVLYGQSCVGRVSRLVKAAAEQEPIALVALLMMQALKEAPEELLAARAGQALLDACPAARMLAGRLLTRGRFPASEQRLEEAKARETDQLLLQQLGTMTTSPQQQSQSGSGDLAPCTALEEAMQPEIQLWLQPALGTGATQSP
jgi:hypothetical protein